MARRLTNRERQVANAICLGHDNQFIAHQLGVSINTVALYMRRMFVKTGMKNRWELFRFLWANPGYLDCGAVGGVQ